VEVEETDVSPNQKIQARLTGNLPVHDLYLDIYRMISYDEL
jgi:hypothetical protein